MAKSLLSGLCVFGCGFGLGVWVRSSQSRSHHLDDMHELTEHVQNVGVGDRGHDRFGGFGGSVLYDVFVFEFCFWGTFFSMALSPS